MRADFARARETWQRPSFGVNSARYDPRSEIRRSHHDSDHHPQTFAVYVSSWNRLLAHLVASTTAI